MSIYHLDTFTIKAFRGIREMSLHGLGRINLLIGANNSGKTSVLEAVQAFCNPENPDKWVQIANNRNSPTALLRAYAPMDCLGWLFQKNYPESVEVASSIELTGDGNCPIQKVVASLQEVFGVPDDEELDFLEKRTGRSRSTMEEVRQVTREGVELSLDSIHRDDQSQHASRNVSRRYWAELPFIRRGPRNPPSFPVASILVSEYRAGEIYTDSYSRLRYDQKIDVLDIARVFDPAIKEISIGSRSGRPYLKIHHEQMGEVPLMVFGDGMKRALLIATSLFVARGGCLLLDEIESGIHAFALADVMRWLFRVAREMNIQVFATTHSLDTVDAMLKASGDFPGEFVTYRLATGGGEAKRIGDKALYDLRVNGGLEIR